MAPFTPALITAWFEDDANMGLANRTRVALVAEGIEEPSDLVDFKDLDTIYANLRKPPKIVGPAARNGALIDQAAFVVSAKSKMRLDTALKAVKYYAETSRPLDSVSMTWATLRNFEIENSALLERKDDTEGPVPKLDKNLAVTKWLESLKIHLMSVIGKRGIPLYYVVRPESAVAVAPPPLLPDQAYSEEHGSVENELIARASHTHALWKVDNRMVFDIIERATRGNPAFSGTITAFRRNKDGRGAFMAYQSQHAGKDVWERNIRGAEFFLQNHKWNGAGNIKFITHAGKHRSYYIDLTEAAEHVPVECPNERSRVTWLLDSIDCKDADLLAAVAAIKQDDPGKRSSFEDAVAFIIPCCPVEKKKVKRTHFSATVASSNGLNTKLKSGIGKTGVELRFHKHEEFWALPEDQRQEVSEHTAAMKAAGLLNNSTKRKAGGAKGNGQANKKKKVNVSSAIAQQGKLMAAMASTLSQTQAALSSLNAKGSKSLEASVGALSVEESPAKPGDETAKLIKQANASALKLQNILKKGKKDKS